ncbi:MAG: polyprenyl synthetase family protein [Eubacteriales bacterium]|nr:polyprenyl synthetase family protein [Eubacteriales bacterium]
MTNYRDAVENALANNGLLLPDNGVPVTEPLEKAPQLGEVPQPLRSAMRYSLLLPGKRIRPVLLLAAYHLLKEDWSRAIPYACAMEMIHTYSLIHDDLPAMDDDALRRGKPTNHKVYGEAMAILAGDGLLNMAYETMLSAPITKDEPVMALRAMEEIACRAGVRGMVAGQTLDVTLEGHVPTQDYVRYIHAHKTADLLTAPVLAGMMLAGATEEQLQNGRKYGHSIGLAFQIVDDLLDLEGDAKAMGKDTGMDAQRGKMTWPTVYGVERAHQDAQECIQTAIDAMKPFGEKGAFLSELARQTLVRRS